LANNSQTGNIENLKIEFFFVKGFRNILKVIFSELVAFKIFRSDYNKNILSPKE